jgi:hypothetical protein
MDLTEHLDRFTEKIEIRYVAAGLLIVIGLALISGTQLSQASADGDQIQVNLTVDYRDSIDSQIVSVNNSSSAFQALNQTYDVGYSESSYGYFITSINGVSGNESSYWIYDVNGETPEVGSGQYSLEEDDELRFSLMTQNESMEATG